MAVARWRQMRIWGMEKAAMELEMRRQADMPDPPALDDDSRSLELINRYESRYDRQYLAHRRFVERRDRRSPPPPPLIPPAEPAKGIFAKRTPLLYRWRYSPPAFLTQSATKSPTRRDRIEWA